VPEPTRSWQDVLGGEPVNEQRAALHARLMRAQELIARARYGHGVDDQLVQDALDAADNRLSEAEQRDDLYVSALAHFVEALGGQLEVRAVFDEDIVVVRPEPDDTATS
jgi:hypothetical protein